MEFRDLKRQYHYLKNDMEKNLKAVMEEANFIQGRQVTKLESKLAEYVGVRYCVSCVNGTDALQLALMTWGIGKGDAVFVPDFTFFSSGEAVSAVGAVPVFVDVNAETYNIDCGSLEKMIAKVIRERRLTPRAVIAVDLFGQPADYARIKEIMEKYHMYILEDAAQGFGGRAGERRACSFGDISITSFFRQSH